MPSVRQILSREMYFDFRTVILGKQFTHKYHRSDKFFKSFARETLNIVTSILLRGRTSIDEIGYILYAGDPSIIQFVSDKLESTYKGIEIQFSEESNDLAATGAAMYVHDIYIIFTQIHLIQIQLYTILYQRNSLFQRLFQPRICMHLRSRCLRLQHQYLNIECYQCKRHQ